jgi:DNA invertase Pin-like site-specific DNA recombinase
MQVDALRGAGCEEVFSEVASGAKTARPVPDETLSRLRAGDVLVIWKLDRLGRSLKHLVILATELME